jgi:hypothetical protein
MHQTVLLVVLIALQSGWNSYGQSIIGDTIFVNAEVDIGIKFPNRPTSYYTNPSNAPYNLTTLPPSGLTIMAKSENTKQAVLFVTEGNNSHQFFLVFKKDINYNNLAETYFDYSSKKVLEQHVKDLAAKKSIVTKPPPDNGGPNKSPSSDQVDKAARYKAIIDEGEKNMKLARYNEARRNFEIAHELMPDDKLPYKGWRK